ncbi:MAG: FtsQ-type POTRA domain-containing protein [Candidatus Eisenbacteria sp.]|nr:FtsQ-type POTRA domain-containing protein [Candidatus Eisenbacteria bacterium]
MRHRRNGKSSGGRGWRGARTAGLAVLVVAVLAVLGVLGLRVFHWAHRSPQFALRQVEIAGHGTLGSEEIQTLYPIPDGSGLLEIDVRDMGRAVEQHPRVLRAVVTRHPPDRLAVRVVERTAVAQVLSDRWYEIDETGMVLGPTRSEFRHSLPKFFGVGTGQALIAGSVLGNPVIARLLALVVAMGRPPLADRHFDRRFSMFLISEDGSLMIPAGSSPATLLVGRKDWIRRLEKFAVVEPHQENTETGPEWIDLRFESQVVMGPMPRWGRELAQAFPGV